jgi:hypothetical protein
MHAIFSFYLISVVATSGSKECDNALTHRIDETLNKVIWKIVPSRYQCICQLKDILWGVMSSDISAKHIPDMIYRIHIWRGMLLWLAAAKRVRVILA